MKITNALSALSVALLVAATALCHCGGSDGTANVGDGDASTDGGTSTCTQLGISCSTSAQCCSGLCLTGFCDSPPR